MRIEPLTWEEKERIREAWVNFLGRYGWDCWFTMTYRNAARSAMNACDRAVFSMRKFYDGLGRELFVFVVAEEHQNGTFHNHGLAQLGALDDSMGFQLRRSLWEYTFRKYGLCRFEPLNEPDAVRAYVSKYLTKRQVDWRLELPKSLGLPLLSVSPKG